MDNWARMWYEKHRDAAKQPAYESINYWNNHGTWRRVDARLARTSWALQFLLDGVRPPVGGFLASTAGQTPSRLYLSRAVAFVQKEAHLSTRLVGVEPGVDGIADALPLLVVAPDDALTAPAAKRAVERLLANDGMAVYIGVSNMTAAATALLAFVPGGKLAPVPDNAPFRAVYRGKVQPALQGIQRADGRLAVLLLPVAAAGGGDAKPADGRLAPVEAMMVLAALIEEQAVRTGLCTPSFPIKIGEHADPFTERVQLLNSLGTRGSGPAADETW